MTVTPRRYVTATLIVFLVVAGAAASPESMAEARQQFDAGRYADAVTTLNAIAREHPNDASTYFWLGRAQYERGATPAAIEALERSVKLAPKDSEAHRWLGRAYGGEADRRRSFSMARRVRREFDEAVRLAPSSVAARRDRLQFFLEAPWIVGGGDGKARDEVEAIAALDPIEGHLAGAAYARDHDDRSRADAEYRAVVAAPSASLDQILDAAEYYEAQENVEGLRPAVERASRISSSDPRVSYFRGVLQVLSGEDAAAAASALEKYAQMPSRSDWPSPAAAHEWLGRLFERTGQADRATAEYRAALALQSDRKSARDRLTRLERGR